MDHRDPSFSPEPSDAQPAQPLSDELLDRYLAGAISPSERLIVEQVLGASPVLADFVAQLRASQRAQDGGAPAELGHVRDLLATRIGFAPHHLAIDTMPSAPAVAAQITAPSTMRPTATPFKRPLETRRGSGTWRRMPWISIGLAAAAVLAFIGAAMLRRAPASFAGSTTSRTYSTGAAQFASVTLADGSRVTLAPNSTLTLPAHFGARERSLSLVGEAHFDIIPDRRMPLSVHTGPVTTRVLGTTFDVRRYAGDRAGRVTVFSGRVAVGAPGSSMTLAAGMTGQFTDSSVTTTATNDSTMYVDWERGQLVFRDAPVALVLETLRTWYGYQFQLADSTLLAHHVSAAFVAGDAREMFNVVQQMLGVNVTRHDSVVILRQRQDAASPRDVHSSHRDNTSQPTEVGR